MKSKTSLGEVKRVLVAVKTGVRDFWKGYLLNPVSC